MLLKMNTQHQAHKAVSVTTGADFPKGMVKRVKLHQCVKFRGNRSNRCRYGNFSTFQHGGRRYHGFRNFKILPVGRLKRVELRRPAKFYRNRSNHGQDMAIFRFFEDGGRRHLGFVVYVRTTHEGRLVVFIAAQNLVGIDAAVLIIGLCMFFDFTSLA